MDHARHLLEAARGNGQFLHSSEMYLGCRQVLDLGARTQTQGLQRDQTPQCFWHFVKGEQKA